MSKSPKAFSLIELSIVILIIGILIAGVTQASRLVTQMRLSSARTLTQSSPVTSIKDLSLWIESTSDKSFDDADTDDGLPVNNWYDINQQVSPKAQFSATTTARPTYTKSGINNLPVLTFDGSANYMRATAHNVLPINPLSIFVVAKFNTLPTGGLDAAIIGFPQTSGGGWRFGCHSNNTAMFYTAWSVTDVYGATGSCNDLNATIFEITLDGTTNVTSFYKNGGTATVGSAAAANMIVGAPISVGARIHQTNPPASFFNGQIAEIIIFSRQLKAEERKSIETYLSKKWAIKIS